MAIRVLITQAVIYMLDRLVGHYMMKRSQQWSKVLVWFTANGASLLFGKAIERTKTRQTALTLGSVLSNFLNQKFGLQTLRCGFSCVTQKLRQVPSYLLSGKLGAQWRPWCKVCAVSYDILYLPSWVYLGGLHMSILLGSLFLITWISLSLGIIGPPSRVCSYHFSIYNMNSQLFR